MDYKIFQLNEKYEQNLFRPYNDKVKLSWYDEVYSGEIEPKESVFITLEELFRIFNMEHPADFKGHSMSVSDVVYLGGDVNKYYYCDSFGFKELPDFESLS